MANFRRRRPRTATHKRGSTTSWRARHGFKAVPVTPFPDVSYWDRGAWLQAWAEWRKQWHWPLDKAHLSQMSGCPAWWDRMFHVRPKRAATRRLERDILRGVRDPDDTAWPL